MDIEKYTKRFTVRPHTQTQTTWLFSIEQAQVYHEREREREF